jgi:hypothetical protein
VHFNSLGKPVAVDVYTPLTTSAEHIHKSWKLDGKRSPWKGAQVLGQTDFWATLRSALRVSVGS